MRIWFFLIFLFFPFKTYSLELSFGGRARGEVIASQGEKILAAGTVARGARQDLALAWIKGKEVIKKTVSFGDKVFIHGLVVRPDGKFVVGGFLKKKCCGDFLVAQFNPDGSLDENFGDKGFRRDDFGFNEEIHYLALQPDGHIVAAGFIQDSKGCDFLIARYLPNGKPDESFGDHGKVVGDFTPDDRIFGVALQGDKIVVAGSVYHPETSDNCAVARYLKDGTLDKNFGSGGLAVFNSGPLQDVCSSVTIDKDGSIVAAGFSTQKIRDTDFFLGRLSGDGQEISVTKTDFHSGTDVAHAVEILPDGKIILGGEYGFVKKGEISSGFAIASYTYQGLQNGTKEIDFKASAAAEGMIFSHGNLFLIGFAGKKMALSSNALRITY